MAAFVGTWKFESAENCQEFVAANKDRLSKPPGVNFAESMKTLRISIAVHDKLITFSYEGGPSGTNRQVVVEPGKDHDEEIFGKQMKLRTECNEKEPNKMVHIGTTETGKIVLVRAVDGSKMKVTIQINDGPTMTTHFVRC